MRMQLIGACLAMVLLFSCGDEGNKSEPDGDVSEVGTQEIRLSGKLVAGIQTSSNRKSLVRMDVSDAGTPLAGYQLYCVTFADPPAAGTGVADAQGQVAIDLEAQGVAFGCFVLDTDGNGVATLFFTSDSQQGQTITLTGDTELGSITVDLDNGVAETFVTTTGSLSGSEDLPCPLGEWVASVSREGECGDVTSVVWFAKTPAGEYTASFTVGPLYESKVEMCLDNSKAGLAVTEQDGTLSFAFHHDPESCPSRMATILATPNEACTGLDVVYSYGPCASCEQNSCGCEDGTEVCQQQFTLVRPQDVQSR